MDEFDETSGESSESSFFDLSDSIGSGLGDIADGIVDVANSAGAAARDSAYMFGDTAQGMYHMFAAAHAAFEGDMAEASAQNDAVGEERRQLNEDIANVRSDLWGPGDVILPPPPPPGTPPMDPIPPLDPLPVPDPPVPEPEPSE
jgi:hypothetical protein